MKTIYLTTTLPYVNADPHLGHALEFVCADTVARYKKLQNFDVFFNTGTDEHGTKVYTKALEQGKDPQSYVDEYAEKFKQLTKKLGLMDDINFIRTTDDAHKKSAQAFWKKCADNGYIYKKNYKMKYCVGCELEKTDSELVNDVCPIHPNLKLEHIEEENYFFKFSAFQEKLIKLYEERPDFVLSSSRFNEIKAFVSRGLEDFSISRLASKMPWGVPVPGDESQVMYVWFDALVNYISAIGWPHDMKTFETYWPVIQFAGKDNLRQQSAMWQAMLMAAGLSPSKQIVIHGFITSEGQKMSKSLGNVINPYDIVAEYGTDALRYFLTREIHPFEDSDFTMERFKESYNAGLANGIGNLTSRIMKMATVYGVELGDNEKQAVYYRNDTMYPHFESFDLRAEMEDIWKEITALDEYIQKHEPFKKIKIDAESAKKDVQYLLNGLYTVALRLAPFMPETSTKILSCVREHTMPAEPLFVRRD